MTTVYRTGDILPDTEHGRDCPIIVETTGLAGVKRPCDRPAGHAGQHIATSYSGRILAVLGDPDAPETSPAVQLDDDVRRAARIIQGIAESALDALEDANSELRSLRSQYRGHEVIRRLLDQVRIPDEYDVECPLAWDAPTEEALAEWISGR